MEDDIIQVSFSFHLFFLVFLEICIDYLFESSCGFNVLVFNLNELSRFLVFKYDLILVVLLNLHFLLWQAMTLGMVCIITHNRKLLIII